jgi:uncharacterized protein YndB with AHSA1/START domain
MTIKFEVSDVIPTTPEKVYAAWLSSEGHSAMTNNPAKVSARVGESFEAWDGYIQGRNLELDPPKRILQSWRTSEFEDSTKDSLLEILFTPEGKGTIVTIQHSELPADGMQYKQGWVEFYFLPMKEYFKKNTGMIRNNHPVG